MLKSDAREVCLMQYRKLKQRISELEQENGYWKKLWEQAGDSVLDLKTENQRLSNENNKLHEDLSECSEDSDRYLNIARCIKCKSMTDAGECPPETYSDCGGFCQEVIDAVESALDIN